MNSRINSGGFSGQENFSETEPHAFEESGWDCTQVGTAALADFENWMGRVIFIDSNLASYRDTIYSKIAVGSKPLIKVFYGECDVNFVEHPLFNSAVARSCVRD